MLGHANKPSSPASDIADRARREERGSTTNSSRSLKRLILTSPKIFTTRAFLLSKHTMSKNDELIKSLGEDCQLWSPSQQKSASPREVLPDKVVLLYFSAHWCPPCRRFTPLLIDLYKKLKERDNNNVEDFELVFCSMDKTENEYQSYTSDMPWWCLSFQSPVLGKLANQYGAMGIPHLVVLDKDGSVLQTDGVGEVSTDADGLNFPWRPKPLTELLPSEYLDNEGNRHAMSDLNDKYLMLYFSAHWCPPCQRFTPQLSKAYTALKQKRDDFELLFVSSDHDQAAFDQYFGEMTFGAIPYEERQAKSDISSKLGVRGIPSLQIFGPVPTDGGGDRPLINDNVRSIIEQGDYISDFPYEPKPYGDVNTTADNINTVKCVIVFHEGGDDDEQEDIQEALQMAAETYQGTETVKFFWSLAPTGLSKTLRDALTLGTVRDEPTMVLLDIPDNGGFYLSPSTDISMDGILAFVENPGERKQL